MISASEENARMLASLLGVEEDEAAERLDRRILVTVADDDRSRALAAEIVALVERTVGVVFRVDGDIAVELVIGRTFAMTSGPVIHADMDARKALVDAGPVEVTGTAPHGLFRAVAACSVAGAVLRAAIGGVGLPEVRLPLSVTIDQIGIPIDRLDAPLELNGAVLIGAGAVGHAFLRALRHLDVRGRLPIVDPKNVGEGNANRCLYLVAPDIGAGKAEALARRAQPDFSGLRLEPLTEDFRSFSKRKGAQSTVFVTVDSRRVRRGIQGEIPRRVLDASTTDVRAIVVHSHVQPTRDACLACIYRHVPDENARERAIADGLGIDLATVKESLVSRIAAERIAAIHPQLSADDIEGKAFDSLFKALCAESALKTPEGRQVLAPFAFVSSLAGALLVVELLRSEAGIAKTNYWQVDPWGTPLARVRSIRPRATDCEFCSKPHARAVAEDLWGSVG